MGRKISIAAAMSVIGVTIAAHAASAERATVEMKDQQGKTVGTIALKDTARGLLMTGQVQGLAPGKHGFHIHAVGTCEPPFTSAGGHFNPTGKKHGFAAAEGAHAGDLPNIEASSKGTTKIDALAVGVTLASLLDADGAAVVLHEKADDYKTDPAGDSGGRVVCGVIRKN